MARQPRCELPADGIYHVTARGVDRLPIVRDRFDWEALHELVLAAEGRFCWGYDVYCLMSSHLHLVVRAPLPRVSRGMHWLNGVYAQRFNRRHERVGHLFENRFSARVMRDETHWENTCRYVLENPVKAGLCELASDWPWSGGRFLRRFDLTVSDMSEGLSLGHGPKGRGPQRARASAGAHAASGEISPSPFSRR
jgi:REP element-mobilizing transposase RayT